MTAAPSQFVFRAMKSDGSTKIGLRTSSTEDALADLLKRDDLLLLSAWKIPLGVPAVSKWPLKDEVALNEQLSTLLSRGVPLVEALEVSATVISPRNKPRIERMLEQVAAGSTFADACNAAGGFDPITASVYRAAERTGDLAGAADRLAKSARRRQAIAGKALTVMIYPSAVASIAVLIFYGLLTRLVPMLAKQLADMEVQINAFSTAVFDLGLFTQANQPAVLGAFLVLAILLFMARRHALAIAGAVIRKLPAIAPLFLAAETARFFSVLGAMTKSGVPLADAIATSTPSVSNPVLREQLNDLRKSLVEGGILHKLLEQVTALPLATRCLLSAAERAGDLDSAFDSLAEDLTNEVDERASRLLALLEPLVIVLMFLLIAPLIFAIALPMMSISQGSGI